MLNSIIPAALPFFSGFDHEAIRHQERQQRAAPQRRTRESRRNRQAQTATPRGSSNSAELIPPQTRESVDAMAVQPVRQSTLASSTRPRGYPGLSATVGESLPATNRRACRPPAGGGFRGGFGRPAAEPRRLGRRPGPRPAVSRLPVSSSCFIWTNARRPRRDCRAGGSARRPSWQCRRHCMRRSSSSRPGS